MLHPIDEAIFSGTLTDELLTEYTSLDLPPEGESYWGDAMHEYSKSVPSLSSILRAEAAVRIATSEMGVMIGSILSVKGMR